jgi:hypothetical protein
MTAEQDLELAYTRKRSLIIEGALSSTVAFGVAVAPRSANFTHGDRMDTQHILD